MPSFRALSLVLAGVALTALGNANETRPGTLRPKLQPQRKSNLLLAANARRDTSTIAGLLVARACSPGYGLCGNGGCCPVGGACCTEGCCPTGEWCYGTGCCLRTQNGSVQEHWLSATSPAMCLVPTTISVVCPEKHAVSKRTIKYRFNSNFCTVLEDRDASGNPGCRSGGGGGGSPTTKTTTTTHTPSTTGNSGGTPTGSAAQNVTIDVSSLESGGIAWVGDWVLVPSSCTPSKMARAVTGNGTSVGGANSLAYFFAGTAIYLSVASRNLQYVVTIDGEDTTSYGVNNSASSPPTPTPANCTFGWSRTGLSAIGEHFLQISIVGPAASASDSDTRVSSRDLKKASDPWMLEMQNLV
ncbi:hypothetical protein C8R46DRAFT_1224192 [Mycena filopes]|nr:hypothetical protein C8R46DRAFT_1224192 [Mycena filopes]